MVLFAKLEAAACNVYSRLYVTTMLPKYTKWAGTGYTYTSRAISATRGVQVSKKVTTLLRHELDDRHWSPDAEGYAFFGDLTCHTHA